MSHARYAGLFLLALVGCFEQDEALNPPLVQNADLLERDVFAAAITHVVSRESAPLAIIDSNIFVLLPESEMARPGLRRIADSVSPPDREVIAVFQQRNTEPGVVKGPLRLRMPYRWITRSDVNPYHWTDGGPSVLVGISRVGFSRDYRKAFLYVMYVCGGLCGEGNFVFLERDASNAWHVTHVSLAWIS